MLLCVEDQVALAPADSPRNQDIDLIFFRRFKRLEELVSHPFNGKLDVSSRVLPD
jgi:hypothetical protein